MDYTLFKEQITEHAKSIGIPRIGFTDAGAMTEYLDFLLVRQKADFKYAINEGDPYRRIDPAKHLAGAQSVICVAVPYPPEIFTLAPEVSRDKSARGEISLISRGRDYHELVMDKLQKLKSFILGHLPEAKILPMVDKEEFLEKAVAVKAGLGWIGKNTLLVTPEFGSFVSLGELVTDIPFPPDQACVLSCHECNRCREACPTQALDTERCLNPDLCLAGISQFKGNIDYNLRAAMGVSLYGCDICQLVCPYNKKVLENRKVLEIETDRERLSSLTENCYENAYPLLDELMSLTNKGFKERFGNVSGAWRGRTVFQRNAIIAAANIRSKTLIPLLTNLLKEDGRPVIRSTAAWALGQIGGEECRSGLQGALEKEQLPEVKTEIQKALKKTTLPKEQG